MKNKENLVSVTDLSKNPSKYISELEESEEVFIMKNNAPVAVLLNYDKYCEIKDTVDNLIKKFDWLAQNQTILDNVLEQVNTNLNRLTEQHNIGYYD